MFNSVFRHLHLVVSFDYHGLQQLISILQEQPVQDEAIWKEKVLREFPSFARPSNIEFVFGALVLLKALASRSPEQRARIVREARGAFLYRKVSNSRYRFQVQFAMGRNEIFDFELPRPPRKRR